MWGLRSFLNGHTSGILFSDLIETGIEAWDIPEVHMAPIIGNHDVPRIATVMNASQDEELTFDAAFEDISELAAAKTSLAWTVNAIQPGLPVLYYGDEWLTRGANDPYNRAPFPDREQATPQQLRHFETVKRWNAFRRSSDALKYGTLQTIHASTHAIALERASEEETLYYVLSKDGMSAQVSLPCSAQPILSEPMQADLVQLDPLTWLIPPMTAVLFEREDPLCAP
jgi:glycosidase